MMVLLLNNFDDLKFDIGTGHTYKEYPIKTIILQ